MPTERDYEIVLDALSAIENSANLAGRTVSAFLLDGGREIELARRAILPLVRDMRLLCAVLEKEFARSRPLPKPH